MQPQNAFIGKTTQPTAAEIATALGTSAAVWEKLIHWLIEEQSVTGQEWKSISPKYGWSLRMKLKKRTIVHLAPCSGCFQVVFIFGARAVEAARQTALPKAVLKIIDEAPRYTEGTGVRLNVSAARDLPAIQKLALVKLAN